MGVHVRVKIPRGTQVRSKNLVGMGVICWRNSSVVRVQSRGLGDEHQKTLRSRSTNRPDAEQLKLEEKKT